MIYFLYFNTSISKAINKTQNTIWIIYVGGGGIILNNSMYFHEIIVKCKCQLERFEHLPKNKLTLIHIVCAVYENNYSMYVIIVPTWNVLF